MATIKGFFNKAFKLHNVGTGQIARALMNAYNEGVDDAMGQIPIETFREYTKSEIEGLKLKYETPPRELPAMDWKDLIGKPMMIEGRIFMVTGLAGTNFKDGKLTTLLLDIKE